MDSRSRTSFVKVVSIISHEGGLETHAGAIPGSITSISKETRSTFSHWLLPSILVFALTIHRIIPDSLPDPLHDTFPSNVLELVRMRDHEADLVVVVVVIPAVQSAANADVLRRS